MDFHKLGKHCSSSTCRQLDFLPFPCEHCDKVYCLEHRLPSEHSCTGGGRVLDVRAAICPFCGITVKYTDKDDINILMEPHMQSKACQQLAAERTKKKKTSQKCHVKGCRVLSEHSIFPCKGCGKLVCVSHRFPDDHSCQQQSAPSSSSSWMQYLGQWYNDPLSVASTSSHSSSSQSSNSSSYSTPSSSETPLETPAMPLPPALPSSSSSSLPSRSSSQIPESKQKSARNESSRRNQAEIQAYRREAKERLNKRKTNPEDGEDPKSDESGEPPKPADQSGGSILQSCIVS